ncbi:hypothetical protein ES703_13111 [subsurface metagenome]
MSLAIKILGCNGLCRSCYENRIRSVGLDTNYDIDAIIETVEKETLKVRKEMRGNTVCLHGGEPLLMKYEDIERLLAKISELYGYTNIQTNGILISDRIIELFVKYKTSIGVSIDGDTWELNYGRWNAKKLSNDEIQKRTDKVLENMRKCKKAGLSLSVITLLRKYNAVPERLPKLIEFFFRLKDEFGMSSIRTNECVVYENRFRQGEELTNEELGHAFCTLADIALSSTELMWLPYRDVVDLMMGYKNGTCVFTQCDVWKTLSEQPIDKDGQIGNCLKGGAAIDGLQVLAADRMEHERSESLRLSPQENGGCKDCRFWHICYGMCPGEGEENDWRNKTRFCGAWKTLFSHIESKIKTLMPNIITAPELYPACPASNMVQTNIGPGGSTWHLAKRKTAEEVRNIPQVKNGGSHGDGHGDRPHGDKAHGDSGHGDGHGDSAHGDHSDASEKS